MTIARMEEDTIASKPVKGWRLITNHSKVAMEWLLWKEYRLQEEEPLPNHWQRIQHARNQGEYQTLVDDGGWMASTKPATQSTRSWVVFGMGATGVPPIVTSRTNVTINAAWMMFDVPPWNVFRVFSTLVRLCAPSSHRRICFTPSCITGVEDS